MVYGMNLLKEFQFLVLFVVLLGGGFVQSFKLAAPTSRHLLKEPTRPHGLFSVHSSPPSIERTVIRMEMNKIGESLGFFEAYERLSSRVSSSILPYGERLDRFTGGWALTYADLSPETESTPAGVAFLATNVAYALVGIVLTAKGDALYGFLTEIAGAVSFLYHYSQLRLGPDQLPVKIALLIDYVSAGAVILTTGVYLLALGFGSGLELLPWDAIVVGLLGVGALALGWIWEFGKPYLVLHSVWHVLSAYSGYLIGQAHLINNSSILQL
uniref:Uncharacterized protein n=1 Tax=Heterosigma akashiwo TaxID=2829 RepID=A0A7S3UU94_HETAK|mmetsp:Transcript_4884/g.7708  ORF Transcript_4884/g.7708 Transcript_4884/m.7708 type:complete len:270 (+) Transcript_4884:41-850(+)